MVIDVLIIGGHVYDALNVIMRVWMVYEGWGIGKMTYVWKLRIFGILSNVSRLTFCAIACV